VPASLRSLAVRYGRWSLAEGSSVVSVSARLGVSRLTLSRWLDESGPESLESFREVVVPSWPPPLGASPGLTLVTPEGFRIEGLDGTSALSLLRSLR
jgi:hypothetical protein